jgi:hypothetical protein
MENANSTPSEFWIMTSGLTMLIEEDKSKTKLTEQQKKLIPNLKLETKPSKEYIDKTTSDFLKNVPKELPEKYANNLKIVFNSFRFLEDLSYDRQYVAAFAIAIPNIMTLKNYSASINKVPKPTQSDKPPVNPIEATNSQVLDLINDGLKDGNFSPEEKAVAEIYINQIKSDLESKTPVKREVKKADFNVKPVDTKVEKVSSNTTYFLIAGVVVALILIIILFVIFSRKPKTNIVS